MSRFTSRLRGPTPVSQWLGGGGVSIKSVQAGTIAITGATSNTATVNAVNEANAILIWLGNRQPTATGDYQSLNARLSLTNATTVTATVDTSPGAATTTVSFVLVEFFSGALRSVQRGTITGTTTATISAVNTAKAFLVPLGQMTDNGVGDLSQAATLVLTNATTVTQAGGGAGTVSGYQVVEFF